MIDGVKRAHTFRLPRTCVGYLRSYQRYDLSGPRQGDTLRGAVEGSFELSSECVIDIWEIRLFGLGFRKPEGYRHAIDVSGKESILPHEFAHRFAALAGVRNIPVHERGQIDLKQVCGHLRTDLDTFAGHSVSTSTLHRMGET